MATIIKTHAAQKPSGDVVRGLAFSLEDISGQAEAYVAEVRSETSKIVSDAHVQADAIRKQAESSGRQAAEQAALAALDQNVAQRMATLLPALEAAIAQLSDARHEWQQFWETQAIGLARAMASRLVRGELANRPEIPLIWVREALQLAAGSTELTLQLAPDDFDTIRGQVEKLAGVFAPAATVHIVSDDQITPGGCRVLTEFGVIDQQIETQLARLEEELNS